MVVYLVMFYYYKLFKHIFISNYEKSIESTKQKNTRQMLYGKWCQQFVYHQTDIGFLQNEGGISLLSKMIFLYDKETFFKKAFMQKEIIVSLI